MGAPGLAEGPSTAREGTSTVEASYGGPTAEQLRRWTEADDPYENLAENEDIQERAYRFVAQNVLDHDHKTDRIKRKWYELNYMLQGQSLRNGAWQNPDHVHVPLLYMMREALAIRLNEAVLALSSGKGEWFKAIGREAMDRRQEAVLTAWHDYCMDKAKYRRRSPEMDRALCTYGFWVVKTRWDRRIEKRVVRNREQEVTKTGHRWKTTRKEELVVIADQPTFDIVDPVWFFCDSTYTDPQEMLYIGDRSVMTLDQIAGLGEQGVFQNWEELEDQEPMAWTEDKQHWVNKSRDQASDPFIRMLSRRPPGAPKQFLVTECWGKFSLRPGEKARECVITIANNQTVLRVQENPYDDKHRPYAIARAIQEPFAFYGPAPLDPCIQGSIEVDTHATLALEGTKHAMCKMVFTEEADALGVDSMWGVEPGKVFQIPAGSVQFADITSPLPQFRDVQLHITEWMQQASGAIPEFTGGDQGNMSATEYQGRIMEANKRVRDLIRATTNGVEQILQQFHSLSAQYLTTSKKFRVLGKAGKALSAYSEVNPQMFDVDVDFEFAAIDKLHVAGMEALQLKEFAGIISQMIQVPGVLDGVDMPKMVHKFAHVMGVNDLGDEIVKSPQDTSMMMSQDEELVLLAQGQSVGVQEEDDDGSHLDVLTNYMGTRDFRMLPEVAQQAIRMHRIEHIRQMERKEAEERIRQQRMDRMAQMPQAAYPGQGSATNLNRQMEAAQRGGGGPSGTPVGETPGPGRVDQVAKPGRSSGFTQAENNASKAG